VDGSLEEIDSLIVCFNKRYVGEGLRRLSDEVNEIIWRLENLFFVKKKPYVNPGMTELLNT
jgi:hypothetical protein